MSRHVPKLAPRELPADVKVAVVAARFNGHIVDELLHGCLQRLNELHVLPEQTRIDYVPGAFELPLAARLLARTGAFDAVICLGCVIRGQTPHFDYVSGECARGIQQVALEQCLPIVFGVLTTNNEQQARDRIGGKHGHAGRRAAEAATEMIALAQSLKQPETNSRKTGAIRARRK